MTAPIKQSTEVEFNQRDVLCIDAKWITRIKNLAIQNKSNKYRTCIHFSDEDNVHEMLIAHTSKTYVRPHKHRINGESLQVVEGEATAIIFNDKGEIIQAFRVGDPSSDYPFYYSMAKAVFHMLLIHTEFLIFKETTRGPFVRDDTLYPDWAPDGKEKKELAAYFDNLRKRLKEKGLESK